MLQTLVNILGEPFISLSSTNSILDASGNIIRSEVLDYSTISPVWFLGAILVVFLVRSVFACIKGAFYV